MSPGRRTPKVVAGNVRLSAREAQVIALVGQGLGNKEIAETLGLSRHTVARHVANARTKLGAANRAEAAVRFLHSDVSARPPRVTRRSDAK